MKQRTLTCCLLFCLLVGTLSLVSCQTPNAKRLDAAKPVEHVVIMWLKDSGNEQHRQELIKVCKTLEQIPGVEFVEVGTMIPSTRDVVDSTYDIGLTVRFKNEAVGPVYQDHPIHLEAVKTIKALNKKLRIYDYRLQ